MRGALFSIAGVTAVTADPTPAAEKDECTSALFQYCWMNDDELRSLIFFPDWWYSKNMTKSLRSLGYMVW